MKKHRNEWGRRWLRMSLAVVLAAALACSNVWAAPMASGTEWDEVQPSDTAGAAENDTGEVTPSMSAAVEEILSDKISVEEVSGDKISGEEVSSDKTSGEETYLSSNAGDQSYYRYATAVNSYLIAGDSGFQRISSLSIGQVLVEYFDTNFKYLSQKYIPSELSKFGGFYEGSDNYYLVFGQDNTEEDNGKEVLRVVRYDKNWNRKGAVSLTGANTTVSIDAGSLRMVEYNGYLYVRTCHEMYRSSDGYNHQGNMTMVVKLADFSLAGFHDFDTSHSFNQFIMLDDEGNLLTLDHGDGNPYRSALLRRFYKSSTDEYPFEYGLENGYFDGYGSDIVSVISYQGNAGDNDTRATIGGFEYSSSSYLTVGSSAKQNMANPDAEDPRNVYVSVTDRNNFSADGTTVKWFTDYKDGEGVWDSTPHLAKLSDNSFLLLWESLVEDGVYDEDAPGKLSYVFLDGKGNAVSSVYTAEGRLSDCKPVVHNGKVMWFVTDNANLTFYSVSKDGTLTKKKAVYPSDMNIYPINIQNCNLIFTKVGVMSSDKEEFSQYLSIADGEKILTQNKDYYRNSMSWRICGGTLGEVNCTVRGIGDYYYGNATLSASPINSQSILNAAEAVDQGVALYWAEETGAIGYQIYRKVGSGSYERIKTIDDNSTVTWTDIEAVETGIEYTYYIRAYTSDGSKLCYAKASESVSVIRELEPPAISSLTNTAEGVKIKWKAAAGTKKYRIFRKTGSQSWESLEDTTSTEFLDDSVQSGTTYRYSIRCLSSDGQSYISSFDSTGKAIQYLSQPRISSIINTTSGVQIKWNSITGAPKYRVFRKTGSQSWETLEDTASTEFLDDTVQSGTTYSYTVQSVSADGKTYTSSYDSTGRTIQYLSAPAVSGLTNTASGVQIKWKAVTGAQKYRVFRKIGSQSWEALEDTASTEFLDQKVQSGTTYRYTVRCISADGKIYTSSYDSKGKTICYLARPKLTGITNTADGMKITWSKVSGAEGYYVYRKTENGKYTKIKKVTGAKTLSYTDTSAKNGTFYYYTVRAYYDSCKSSYVDKGIGALRITAPKISSLTNKKGKKLAVTWSKNNSAAGYQIQYAANSKFSGAVTVNVKRNTSLSKTITGLKKGSTCYVRIRSYNSVSGTKYYSDWSSVKKAAIVK
ncbi:MAG: fibronectin type III domain-containing protein [Clostridiales bacterium]|nr:fibronectin type III domain-containing protein [Clostridiales bacterium]